MGDMLKKAYDDSMLDCPEKPMTSKLKCPVCGGDIQYNDGYSTYDCKNNPAIHNASEEIWQALIQAKQDLEIARKAFKRLKQNAFLTPYAERVVNKALEQIEHKEER